MVFIQCFLAVIVAIAFFVIARLSWASYKLRNHPSVEPIAIAHPEIAPELNQLIHDISKAANLDFSPALFVRRGALPNAFIAAVIIRPELFISDELLEQCDTCNNGLEELMRVLCHEIAHLQRHDAIRLGLLTYIEQSSHVLRLKFTERFAQNKIAHIEKQTDLAADEIFKKVCASE